MRLMTGHTPFQTHDRVLEGKRPPFVGMALDTGRFISKRESGHLGHETIVWLVTIYTMNGAFVQSMMKRLKELSPDLLMAGLANLVDAGCQQMLLLTRFMY